MKRKQTPLQSIAQSLNSIDDRQQRLENAVKPMLDVMPLIIKQAVESFMKNMNDFEPEKEAQKPNSKKGKRNS